MYQAYIPHNPQLESSDFKESDLKENSTLNLSYVTVVLQNQVQMMFLLKLKPVQIVVILTVVQRTENVEGKGHQVYIQREDLV